MEFYFNFVTVKITSLKESLFLEKKTKLIDLKVHGPKN